MDRTSPLRHVHMTLRLRLRIYGMICALLLGFVAADVIRFGVPVSGILAALIVGVAAGIGFSFTHHISWDSENGKVVARLDLYGIVLLALYAALELNRDAIARLFAHGSEAAVIGYATLAGVMFGRGFGMSRRIVRILRRERKIKTR